MPKATINVAIDQPLLSDTLFVSGKALKRKMTPLVLLKSFLSLLSDKPVRIAIAVFLMTFVFSSTLRTTGGVGRTLKILVGNVRRLLDRFQRGDRGVPMSFDTSVNEGWGVCTLRSKRRLGKTNFMEYEFELPDTDYVLPLDLGQQISLMCLDGDGDVATGDFFPYQPDVKQRTGKFSVLIPSGSHESNIASIGVNAANFVRVMMQDIQVGDEIALRPGISRLSYKGQYLPVTDMMYVACGSGIVPVLDQVRAVLPSGSSSVESVTVLWINEETRDFDVVAEILEQEYYKYSSKLAVSCVVDSLKNDFGENPEVKEAVHDFRPGTMAVLAGPMEQMRKATTYLEKRGYPRDTICVL